MHRFITSIRPQATNGSSMIRPPSRTCHSISCMLSIVKLLQLRQQSLASGHPSSHLLGRLCLGRPGHGHDTGERAELRDLSKLVGLELFSRDTELASKDVGNILVRNALLGD